MKTDPSTIQTYMSERISSKERIKRSTYRRIEVQMMEMDKPWRLFWPRTHECGLARLPQGRVAKKEELRGRTCKRTGWAARIRKWQKKSLGRAERYV